ncbi:hypothetical protein GCM10027258_27010 [Amycolatopsis stemonae]
MACARALASATVAASWTVPAPICASLAAIASLNSGWSSTTNTEKSSSRGCGTMLAGNAPAGVDRTA